MIEDVSEGIRVDWRCGVAALIDEDYMDPYTGNRFARGSVVVANTAVQHDGREIRFADPSAMALFLSQAHRTYEQAMRTHPLREERTPTPTLELASEIYDYLEVMTASVIFGYTALEAFANEEIPEDFVYEQRRESSGIYVPRNKAWIERWVSLGEKLAGVLPRATGKPSPKGSNVWQRFVILRRLRNRIVHLKTEDRARSRADNVYPKSIWADLLRPEQPSYPRIAKDVILYFRPDRLKGCPF